MKFFEKKFAKNLVESKIVVPLHSLKRNNN